jgi:hypothetical protein
MAVQHIVCLTAGQRSGTTALRSLMSETGRFADLGEIFDTAIIDEPQSFFGYCKRNKVQYNDILSGPDAEALCKKYVGVLRELSPGRHVLFDVKFNSWGELRMPWTFMHQEPFFLRQLKWRSAKILFIWRRDLVSQILSDRISDAIGKWHNLTPEDATKPIRLDAAKLAERAKLMCLSEKYFFNDLKSYSDALMLSYEALFDSEGRLAQDSQDRIARLVGETLAIPQSGLYRRSGLEKEKIVENYDEIVRAIQKVCDAHRDPVLANNTII